ncbi:hypothetical protein BHE74_00044321 [Ensete ventricosum]|nr:hypothetical protein GW17_00054896 [Ensete ventricosum]RWW49499.1 hypothetical protein BHE74_00044321 [Ensete ventricosum]RZS11292.1 hypothetical protein BHM03_00042608 [Ensete ventricosum]
MHRVDAVGNSPGVHRKLAEGIGSSSGWRKRVRQKKTETHRKIVGGSRKACREDSPKGPGSSLGTRREIAGKKTGGLAARMPETTELCGKSGRRLALSTGKPPRRRVNRPYLDFSDTVGCWLRF